MSTPAYDFENFPRRELVMQIGRREMFGSVLTELRVTRGRGEGGVAFRLADLGLLPDEQLAAIRPSVVGGCAVEEEHGFVWARFESSDRRVRMFPSEQRTLHAFRAFDGTTQLGAIAEHVTGPGEDGARTFAFARGVFLHLVTLGVCVPG